MKSAILTLIFFISFSAFGSVASSFTCDAVSGCSPLVVNATDHSSPGVASWRWDLGNGNTSTQRNPSATYLTPGTYTIKLTVTDGTQTSTSSQVITVFQKPVVNFTSDRTTACSNDTIHFTTQATAGSAPIAQYAWGFGNGIASSQVNPAYKYSLPGIYDVTLVVEDSNGCVTNMTRPGYLHIWEAPRAVFTLSPAVSCGTSQLVRFTDQSTGTGLTYQWTFGDSTASTVQSPAHTFAFGKYRTVLTVSNSHGCKGAMLQAVSVINLHADFTADKTTACAGEEINFQNLSPMSGTTWSWSFGDGGTSNKQNPKHIYTNPGVYDVTFIVRDGICSDSVTKRAYITITEGFSLAFTADRQKSCTTPFTVAFASHASTGPLQYAWDFGDGKSDTSASPTTTYTTSSTFNVTLTAVDTNGCKVSLAMPGLISTSRPSTKFIGDTLVCPGSAVKFTNRTLSATHYLWQFGDGDTSTATSPSHIYSTIGTYTVTLTAIDSAGCDSTVTKPAFVRVDSTKVDFKVDQTFSPCPPLVSVFSSVTNRPDLKFRWDFGDGYTDTAANPTHIFFHPGIYTVKLIGTSRLGCTDTIIYPHLIEVQGPSGDFHVSPASGCVPVVVNFTGTMSSNVQSITCDLGDGRFYSDSLNFSYTYTGVRTYHPKFILTDHVGCTVPYELDSVITRTAPMLHLSDTSICPGQAVHMALGTDRYTWTARVCDTCGRIPSITDTISVATLIPAVTTTYTVTATNGSVCTTTDQFTIHVIQPPALLSQDTIRLCGHESAILSVGLVDSVSWQPAIYLSDPHAVSPICTPSSSMTYTATGYNHLGCASTMQVPVKVVSKVTVAITGDTTVCPGSPVQLQVSAIDSSVHGVNYTWSPASLLDAAGSAHPAVLMLSQSQVISVITSSGGCTPDTSSVTISVSPGAHVALAGSVTATVGSELHLAPQSGDLTSYRWTATDSLSCPDCRATVLVPLHTQVAHLTGTNKYGCTASDSILVNVLQCDPASVFVPNTFTPNGDGLHDVLYVRSRTLTTLDGFRIFDRWGAMIYEGKDMDSGWDGLINGEVASQGVYIYTVSGQCAAGYDLQASGTVTLLR